MFMHLKNLRLFIFSSIKNLINYQRIIAPITSRCSQFRFKPLSTENQKKRLLFVCQEENVKISDEVYELKLND